jgi:spore maturation protein CgeB
MKIVMFYHSLLSDWNHGNAHFLRGIVSELKSRGHAVNVYEPENGWSIQNLIEQKGSSAVDEFYKYYPDLSSSSYKLEDLDLDSILDGSDLVIVHEWNDHELVRQIGEHRKRDTGYKLLFHDTHHRSLTDMDSMSRYELSEYDGVLAYGNVIREIYLSKGWAHKAWTWHEAADTRIFHPIEGIEKQGDLIWIGNWGDEERTRELYQFLLEPVKLLGIKSRVYGVRYPGEALEALKVAGIDYGDWLPNYKVPLAFAQFRLTIHVPRRPYVESLRGIPTIRPFEALACGIPLISSPWQDTEGLFRTGEDFLIAKNGNEMKTLIKDVLNDKALAESLSVYGLETILKRHTCAHRVDQLMDICREIGIKET